MNQQIIEKIAPRLTELMIRKMETLTEEWQQPWIFDMTHGLPRNLRGTPYRAGNVLMLLFLTQIANFRSPVFLTYKQAKDEGLSISKGTKSFPVYFWTLFIRHKQTKKKIDPEEFYRLSKEQRKQYDKLPVMRYYPVFNIDQSDMRERQPERYASLTRKSEPKDYSDGLNCGPIDRMLDEQSWLCPIELKFGDDAAYYPLLDKVVCPRKEQFPQSVAFYTTLLHEITHSTAHPERLNRTCGKRFGDTNYAHEELVAELTAALCGAMYGFASVPQAENAAYLKCWLQKLNAEPTFLFDVLTDVNKAAKMIVGQLGAINEAEHAEEIPAEAA